MRAGGLVGATRSRIRDGAHATHHRERISALAEDALCHHAGTEHAGMSRDADDREDDIASLVGVDEDPAADQHTDHAQAEQGRDVVLYEAQHLVHGLLVTDQLHEGFEGHGWLQEILDV